MKIKLPGKVILLIGLILACAFALSAADRQVNLSSSGNHARLLNNSDLGFDVQFRVGDLKIIEVQTKKGTFDELSIDGWGFSNDVGEPKLPMLRRTIAVPLGAEVRFYLNSQSTRELDSKASKLQNRVIPAQEPISRAADPATLPFEVNERLYSLDEFNNRDWVQVTELGMMRGVRVFALDFYPVRYNPVTNSIQVMENVDVRVDFVNPDLIATADMLARTASWEFEQLYSRTIFNWNADNRTVEVRHPTKMVILCPVGYTSNIQSYVDWKTQQGFAVIVATVGSGGTVANNTTAIKNYMQGLWDAATADDPAPTYLLIIGDESGTITVATNSGATSSHVTDLTYVRLNGSDYMPEMYHGRFSVSSTTELANIINKTITFEKTQMPDISYLGKTVLIAGVDSSWSPTHANGAINYATTEYFNAAHGITSDTYLYPASGSSDAQIIANANEGRGYIVYTAHGSQTSWHDPSFTVSDVNAMTNSGKYGVMVGNCCITNEFDYSSPCFGEAVIRKADGGGVAYIGGTNSTYWNEDYYWAVGYKTNIDGSAPPYDATKLGAYDAMFHTHGETYDKWATTVGETIYSGNLAVQQSGSSRTNYYWEVYHIMGDPSLMPYLGVPTANPANYPTQIMIGNNSYAITGAAPYTRVGLSMNGVIYGSGITDASGNLTLTISPFTSVGTAKLVLTAQNRITTIADIAVIAAQGPFMSVDQVAYDDANNDIPEYNESGYFDVTFKNVGVDPATNVSAILSCSTSGITITDNSHSISSLAAGATVLANNAYAITIANNVADGTVANFTITMTMSGHDPWTYNFTQTINAPALAFGNMTISDPTGNNNGRLDPGETVTITMPLNNNGGAASPNGTATMSCATPGITVNNGNASFSAISAGGVSNLTFSLTANASMDIGTVVSLNFAATAGQYSASKTENTSVGLIIEDFSTGDFSSFPWIMGGTLPWTIDSSTYYSAGYSARSGAISHSQTSTMETTRVLSAPGELSFWYKVSSESNYDKLRFYVDGTQQNEWSGNIDWTQATYNLAAGTRVLKWEYVKDYSVSSGSDCAWVDDIIFPASTTPSSFYPPRNLTALAGNGYVTLNWNSPVYGTPTGYRIYRDGNLLTTVTGLTYTDNAVVNETTYSYYLVAVYSGGVSDPTDTVQATPSAIVPTEVIIGTGTGSNGTSTACPVNQFYRSLHGQAVYTAAELNAAGVVGPINITKIGFNITGLPAQAMPNFVVRMGHTTATNVSSWISTGLTQVWSSSSYLPTATGWNMYTLSTPFLWNGIDNIVVDTAFNQIASWNYSGTTEYTEVSNGYRYVRQDSSNQGNIFSGGSISSYRPNLKLTLLPNQSGPVILVNPTTLAYGDVAVGSTDTKTFTIQNSGDQTLTGTITTPTGYTVAAARNSTEAPLAGKESRNSLSFSINAGATKTYNLTFAPTAVASYNGNVVVANNSINNTSVNIAVTGTSYIPPTIDIDNDALYAYLQVGAEDTDSFTITNTGSQPLTFSISMTELPSRTGNLLQAASAQEKSIAGSTVTLDASSYLPGTTVDWTFTATNASTDTEWMEDVIISFPAGVTVNSATNFVGGSGGDMTPDVTSGNGVTITWHGETSSGWGVIQGGQSASATVNVTISSSFGGNLTLPWTLNGDIYGSEPHTLSGSNVLTQDSPPISWLSIQPLSGNIAAGESQTITAYFSAVGMAVGTYEAMLTIHSNDPINPTLDVSATMDVWDTGNHAPTINLPDSFSFDRNGSLTVNFNSYVSDEDGDPLTLGYSGNTNVFVAINGLNVTFTAAQNWTGSETITFSVYDGHSYAYDSVVVTVNEVAGPGWTPVVYPNSATIHGIVTIYGVAAELNDVVGAFVGSECRGVADVVTNGGNAYVTLVVNLASNGEEVSFKIYDYSASLAYDAIETYTLNYNQVIGTTDNPVPISVDEITSLDAPVITSITKVDGGFKVTWNAVDNAESYQVYRATDPYGTYTLIGTTANLLFSDLTELPMAFYYVKAVRD
jgi:hypothetical protein